MKLHDARKDLLAGAVFVGFGLAFAVTSSSYEVGSRPAHGARVLPARPRRDPRPCWAS
jgi:hypothetical protein